MTIEEEQKKGLALLKEWNNNGEFFVNETTYKLVNQSHQFRAEVLSVYSQIEAQIIMGNYAFLQRDDFKKVFAKVEERVLFEDMQLSKLPKHWEEYPQNFRDFIATSLKVIVAPLY